MIQYFLSKRSNLHVVAAKCDKYLYSKCGCYGYLGEEFNDADPRIANQVCKRCLVKSANTNSSRPKYSKIADAARLRLVK